MRKKIVISDQGKSFIDKGQDWMYLNNLVSKDETIKDGEIIDVYSEDDQYVATGFYSNVNHIVVRIFSRENLEEYNHSYFKQQLKKAIEYRKEVMGSNFDNCRLVYAEADHIPGLIVDRYSELLVTQISCKGIENIKEDLYADLFEILQDMGQEVVGIYERNDIKARDKEGLQQYKGFWHGLRRMPITTICENGINIIVDVENGQKTGYFLDQKENRMIVRNYSKNKKVLDCFSHTGGFALNAAKGGALSVTAVDVSAQALNTAKKIAEFNNLENMNFVQDDVFEYLDKVKKGEFDIIILDPPAFTKSRATINKAYAGYCNINAKAMKLLNKGGLLVTCSCSRYMERSNFENMLKDAAQQANVTYKVLQAVSGSKDHMVDKNNVQSEYLKFYVLEIGESND